MRTFLAVGAGFAVLLGVKWGFAAVAEGVEAMALEAAALRLGVDLVAAGGAGAVAAYLGGASSRLASLVFFFTFCALFLVADGPYVWFEVARLPLLPGCVLLGGKLMLLARRAG